MVVWTRWRAGEDDLRAPLAAELRRRGMSEAKAKAAAADNLRTMRQVTGWASARCRTRPRSR